MAETVQVTARLVAVSVPVEARPGDKLMLIGDVCIGVLPAAQACQGTPAARPSGHRREMTVEQVRIRILALLRERGSIPSQELRAMLGPGVTAWRLRAALHQLTEAGLIERQGPYRALVYALAKGG